MDDGFRTRRLRQRGPVTTPTSPALTPPITSAADLARFWAALMGDGGFGRRTLWLVLLDDEGRPAPAVVPVDDVPDVPSAADVDSFGHFFDHLGGYGTPVLLLSRPGPPVVGEDDRQWGRALAPLAPRWPVHLAAEDAAGHCVVTPLG